MDAAVKWALWICSLLYGLLVGGLRFLYSKGILPSFQAPRPVLSVGSITVGGAGKTPLVIAIARALVSRQVRTAILIRGYMPSTQSAFSDEAHMLKESLPEVLVLTGPNRRKNIEACLKHHAVDVFVCDDGFQHWPLRRDLDIVAVDTANPFGNGHVVPRGLLREPIGALRAAGMFILTKTDHPHSDAPALRERLAHINPGALMVESHYVPTTCVDVFEKTRQGLEHLQGITVVGFCGIADPTSFRESLQQAGLQAANIFVFMDHHMYTEEDMAMVRTWAREHNVQNVVTTHKDAVKILPFKESWQGYRVHYLQVESEITYGKNVFLERIMAAVRH